jgi:hypothetical protein
MFLIPSRKGSIVACALEENAANSGNPSHSYLRLVKTLMSLAVRGMFYSTNMKMYSINHILDMIYYNSGARPVAHDFAKAN